MVLSDSAELSDCIPNVNNKSLTQVVVCKVVNAYGMVHEAYYMSLTLTTSSLSAQGRDDSATAEL